MNLIDRLEAVAAIHSDTDFVVAGVCREAASALRKAPNDGWQPIKTAPSAREVLLWEPPDETYVGLLYDHGWCQPVDDILYVVAPTHWRPLPEAPTTEDEQP